MMRFIAAQKRICAPILLALINLSLWAQAAGQTTELTYWFAYSGAVQETNEYLTKAFNEGPGKQKGIHVTPVYQAGYPELNQKVQAALVAGDSPDVFVMEIGTTGMFAQNGAIIALDPLIAKDKLDMSDFQPGILGNCQVGGKIVALPFMPSTCILYMNTTILKAAGLDPSGPKTWEELASYCKAIKSKTGAYGMTMVSNVWFFEALLLESGTSALSPDEKTSNIATKAAKSAVKFYKDLKDSGDIRILASAEGSKLSTDIMNQKCGMWLYSTAGMTTFLGMGKSKGFEINTCFMPKQLNYGTSTGGSNLVISSKIPAARQAAAWEFVKWMTSTEQTIYASAHTGYMPSRKSAIESPTIKSLYASMPQFKVALDQMPYAQKRPMNPGYTEGSAIMTDALDAIWVNGKDIDATLSDAKKRMDRALADY